MTRIGRRAVLAHRDTRGIVGVEPVMTVGTQAAELAQPERGEIAMMRRVVIGDARRRDVASLQAEPTQGLDHELMTAAALPARGAVPTVDFRTVRHRGVSPRALGRSATARIEAMRDRRGGWPGERF